MASSRKQYTYPVRTVNDVKAVIEPEFQPDLFDKQQLYVDLDEIRDRTYLNDLFFDLGYNPAKKTYNVISDYIKIIFSGHRGCGKSAELRRINNELNRPDRYLTVFIDLEKEVEVGSFQYAEISRTIRREIKQNTLTLVYNLNAELVETKIAIEKSGQGKDILFIIDGSEKVKSEVYDGCPYFGFFPD